jgi:sensor histidine kinase YesM
MAFSRKFVLAVALLGLSEMAAVAAPTVTYVGLGRYSCSGSAVECAQINFNNSQLEEMNRRRNQEDQDRAQRYIEENRQRERERKDAEQR